MNIFDRLKSLYDNLEDDISKTIFENRFMWNLTEKYQYIENIEDCLSTKLRRIGMAKFGKFEDSLDAYRREFYNNEDLLIVYGLGFFGRKFVDGFEKKEKLIICDKNICGEYKGIPIVSPERIETDYVGVPIIIATIDYEEEIYQYLKSIGVRDDNIYSMGKNSRLSLCDEYNQYFESGIINPMRGEVFLDCGFYHGETSKRFVQWCGGEYDRIIGFEVNNENIEFCKKEGVLDSIDRMTLVDKGTWKESSELKLDISGRNDSSHISQEGTEVIHVISIDEVLNGGKVTFIKMDIEGAELMSLLGAKETIKKYKPRMAICIYHKTEDIIEIQEYLQSLELGYKYYIRQYSNYSNELVLYAV